MNLKQLIKEEIEYILKQGDIIKHKGTSLILKQDALAIKNKVEREIPNLFRHSHKELKLAGYFDSDKYNKVLAKNILSLVLKFAHQGHSGMSTNIVKMILNKLLDFQNITDLTNDPSEWNDMSEYSNDPKDTIWQNKRNSAVFSNDRAKTWYDVNENFNKSKIIKEIKILIKPKI